MELKMEPQMEWLNFSENFTLPFQTCFAEIITKTLAILIAWENALKA